MFKKMKFAIDGENDIFEGITNGQRWNGFQCPYFSLETSKKVILSQGNKEDFKNDNFWISYYELSDIPKGILEYHEDGIEFYKAIQFEGEYYYPIGFGNWTWEFAKFCPLDDYEDEIAD